MVVVVVIIIFVVIVVVVILVVRVVVVVVVGVFAAVVVLIDVVAVETLSVLLGLTTKSRAHYQVCGNVAGLCSWTIAMKSFFFVNRVVLPLVNSQKRMEAKHDKAMSELDDANKTLEAKNAEVNEKQKELAEVGNFFLSLFRCDYASL